VDAAGTATDAYSLDAFGRYMGGWTNPTQNPYRGACPERSRRGGAWGYITDTPGSGLLQLGNRVYWPEMGRFIQQDPEGDGDNWYAYAESSPLVSVDPEGLWRRGLLSRIGKAVERAVTWPVRAVSNVIMNAVWPEGSRLGSNISPSKVNPGLEDIYATLGRGEGFDAREAAKQCLVVPVVAAGMQVGASFASEAALLEHFERHAPRMRLKTPAAYLEGARGLVQGGPGVETFVRANGDTLFYRWSEPH
jgi:RHS repeat-associated protein